MTEDREPPHSRIKGREHVLTLPPETGPLADAALASIAKRTPLLQLVRRLNPTKPVDGMAKTVLEYETADSTPEDRHLAGWPLLWTHSDVHRFADAEHAEIAGRRVGETMEKAACGTVEGIAGRHATIAYGLTTHPERMTVADDRPLADRIDLLWDAGFPGPYVLAHGDMMREYGFKTLHFTNPGKYENVPVHFLCTPFIANTNELAARTEVLFDVSPRSVCVVESLSPRMVRWEERFDAWYKVVAGWTLWIRENKAGKVGVVHAVLPAPARAEADAPLEVKAR